MDRLTASFTTNLPTTMIRAFNPGAPPPSRGLGVEPTQPGGTMGKDEFLRLLVTQMRYQDPLNPLEGQEFAVQLAQFSSVEQLMRIGDLVAQGAEVNGALTRSLDRGLSTGLIGKTVEADINRMAWDGEGFMPAGFRLPADAAGVEVTIYDANGQPVRTLTLGSKGAGSHTLDWDGKDDRGATVPHGTYTFRVKATGLDGAALEATPFVRGRVERVTLDQDDIQLWIGGLSLPMGKIRSVNG